MKILRSTKTTIKFATHLKRQTIQHILTEYARVINEFISLFWLNPPAKHELFVSVYSQVETWLSSTLCQTAAREALGMISAAKQSAKELKTDSVIPVHRGRKMQLTQQSVKVGEAATIEFDFWLNISAITKDRSIRFSIPCKKHKHFKRLERRGQWLKSYVITPNYVQFSFKISTPPKKKPVNKLGLDTGINSLASLSNGQQFGKDIKLLIERVKNCPYGSKGQQRARRALKQKIDQIAKQVVHQPNLDLLVVEKLKNLNNKTKIKRRLNQNMRRSLGAWNYRRWLERLEQNCEQDLCFVPFCAFPIHLSEMSSM